MGMTDQEIVKALAEKVFGLTDIKRIQVVDGKGVREAWGTTRRYRLAGTGPEPGGYGVEASEIPNPLTSDADACAVLDKMAEDDTANVGIQHLSDGWRAWTSHYNSRVFEVRNKDRRRAICLVALKSVGVEV